MKINCISVFSLLFVTTINTTPTTRLDMAKEELNNCKKSNSSSFNCNKQEQAFNDEKTKFLAAYYDYMDKAINTPTPKYNHNFQSNLKNIPIIGSLFTKHQGEARKKHQQIILIGWGSGQIVEAFDGKNNCHFLDNDLSLKELYDNIIDDSMRKYPAPGGSSLIEDKLGNRCLANIEQSAIDTAKKILKEDIFRKQTQ